MGMKCHYFIIMLSLTMTVSQLWIVVDGRTLDWITIKQNDIDPRDKGDKYGHYWIEILDGPNGNPIESYGWWPKYQVGLEETLKGVPGELNGITTFQGTATRDPKHGKKADKEFHPVLTNDLSDEEVLKKIHEFVQKYNGEWQWVLGWGQNCQTFQKALMKEIGLREPNLLDTMKIGFPLLPSPTSDTSPSDSNKGPYVPPTTTVTKVTYSYNVVGDWNFYVTPRYSSGKPVKYTFASDGYVNDYINAPWYTGYVPQGEWTLNGNQVDWFVPERYVGPWGEIVFSSDMIGHHYGTIDENGILRMSNWFVPVGYQAYAEKIGGNAMIKNVVTTSVPSNIAGVGPLGGGGGVW